MSRLLIYWKKREYFVHMIKFRTEVVNNERSRYKQKIRKEDIFEVLQKKNNWKLKQYTQHGLRTDRQILTSTAN